MKITVEMNADTGLFELWCTDQRMCPMPAGPRLFRADPPAISFEHAELGTAESDAKKLRVYLDSLEPAKKLTKRQLAEQFA